MSGNIRLYNTNGYVELQAPTSASAQTLVLPTDSIQPGLVHLNTTSFTAVSSVSVDNVFSSTYENYKVTILAKTDSGSVASLYTRLRSSGSNNSTSNSYKSQELFVRNNTNLSGSILISDYGHVGSIATGTSFSSFEISFFRPNLTTQTNYKSENIYTGISSAVTDIIIRHVNHNQEISFDGLTFYPSAYTITGSVSVYGYRNA